MIKSYVINSNISLNTCTVMILTVVLILFPFDKIYIPYFICTYFFAYCIVYIAQSNDLTILSVDFVLH